MLFRLIFFVGFCLFRNCVIRFIQFEKQPKKMSKSERTSEKIAFDTKNSSIDFDRRKKYLPWVLMAAIILLTIFVLRWEGRIWWCKWDSPYLLWSSDAWSKHSSQHLFDPYSFTHVLHGLLYYAALFLIFRRRLPIAWLLFFALSVESGWEILENSNAIIERYRHATVSLDYFGDSIANSFGDILSCAAGFFLADKLRLWRSIALFALIEIVLIFTIRDSLLINIIMLIHPIDAIKTWQTGG